MRIAGIIKGSWAHILVSGMDAGKGSACGEKDGQFDDRSTIPGPRVGVLMRRYGNRCGGGRPPPTPVGRAPSAKRLGGRLPSAIHKTVGKYHKKTI